MTLSLSKFHIDSTLKFICCVISDKGVFSDPDRSSALSKFPVPSDQTGALLLYYELFRSVTFTFVASPSFGFTPTTDLWRVCFKRTSSTSRALASSVYAKRWRCTPSAFAGSRERPISSALIYNSIDDDYCLLMSMSSLPPITPRAMVLPKQALSQ